MAWVQVVNSCVAISSQFRASRQRLFLTIKRLCLFNRCWAVADASSARKKKITFFSRTFWTNEAMKMSSDWGYSLLRRKSEILRQEDFDEAPRACSPRLIPVSLHFGSCVGCWDEMKSTVDCVPVFLCRWHWCQHGQSGQWKRMSASVGGCLQRLLLGEWHCKIHWKLQAECDPQDPPKCRLCKKKKINGQIWYAYVADI